MLRLLIRVLAILAVVWLLRYLWSALVGSGDRSGKAGDSARVYPPSGRRMISGEMKKDPHCGTYVSTDLSLKTRLGGEELHFCSRECQQAFLRAGSGKTA